MDDHQLTGGDVNYYLVDVPRPKRLEPYRAECEDIIEALGMNFAEGCAFKAIWRKAAARNGNGKPGNTALYDAEKIAYYGSRLVAQESTPAAYNHGTVAESGWIQWCGGKCPVPVGTRVDVGVEDGRAIYGVLAEDVQWRNDMTLNPVKKYRISSPTAEA